MIGLLLMADVCTAEPSPRLTGECDALLRTAVRRTYGWAWGPTSGENEGRRVDPVDVSLGPLETPAAGLILYLASETLHQPRYFDAAVQAARGLVAAQEHTGRVPGACDLWQNCRRPGPAPVCSGSRADPRGARVVAGDSSKAGKARPGSSGAALRAAYWLAKQQPRMGGFPLAYPPDADSQ